MRRLILMAAIAVLPLLPQAKIEPFRLSDVMAPVPIPERFAPFWAATDPASGISIKIIQAHTSPRCREEHNCPWIVEWHCSKDGERAEIRVDAGDHGSDVSYVPANPKEAARFQPHRIKLNPADVQYIRIVVTAGTGRSEREVARATFR